MLRRIIVDVDAQRRLAVYPEGGIGLEARVPGIGWVLDNEAWVSDDIIRSHVQDAIASLDKIRERLAPIAATSWSTEEILAREG